MAKGRKKGRERLKVPVDGRNLREKIREAAPAPKSNTQRTHPSFSLDPAKRGQVGHLLPHHAATQPKVPLVHLDAARYSLQGATGVSFGGLVEDEGSVERARERLQRTQGKAMTVLRFLPTFGNFQETSA